MDHESTLFKTNAIFKEFDICSSLFTQRELVDASISECAILYRAVSYNEVNLYFLDLSSESTTGTFKDWAACATVAYCKRNNIDEFVTQSSGNTANAIAKYCRENGIKSHIFYLKENESKIKRELVYDDEWITLHEVASSEKEMKKMTEGFSFDKGIPWLPNIEIQIQSNSIRADIVQYISNELNIKFDWKSQALSSGYGVFGFYNGLNRLGVNPGSGYKLHGVQQSAVCPYVNRFFPNNLEKINFTRETVIEKTLFRTSPTDNLYELMRQIIDKFGGHITVVTNRDYDEYSAIASSLMMQAGIKLRKDVENSYLEKSGLINTCGILKAIQNGLIKGGENVLVAVTGGGLRVIA